MTTTGITNIEQKDNQLILSRVFDAPKELVFSMFTGDHIAKWWGPTHWPVKVSHMDFRPGGEWHYCMVGPDGEEAWGKALYDEIDEPNKIIYRDVFSDKEGNVDTSLPQGRVEILFEDEDGKTKLTTRGTYESADAVNKLVEMGMLEGIKDTWEQLDDLLHKAQQ